ncbi:MAG: SusD/RagB family nutrient-binding outer membrane lipoprotein [Chitinophagales bacterium]
MRHINKLFIFLFSLLIFSTYSCEETFEELNTDPDNPVVVPNKLLLPSAETFTAFGVAGADLAWYTSVWVQHTAGVWNQMENADKLTDINSQLANNVWRFQLYSGSMMDLKQLIDQATEQGADSYVGISKILMAYNLGLATDAWGRIPYSDALQGTANIKPVFDSQESIYQNIQTLLDEGISTLQSATDAPSSDDVIYGGDLSAWIKAAYALKARYYNHLSNRDANGSAQNALTALQNAFDSSSDDFSYAAFNTNATGENPWYQFQNDRDQHCVSESFVALLKSLNDPRLPIYALPVPGLGTIVGGPNAQSTDQGGILYSKWGSSLVTAAKPLPMMTFVEQKFIEAEAELRLGNASNAKVAYETAIGEAMRKVGVSEENIATYIAQASVSPATLTLKDIITQKYISQFVMESMEAYNDWRRTDVMTLTNPAGPIPVRFPYPTSEYDYNLDNVPGATVNDGVWWDDGSED